MTNGTVEKKPVDEYYEGSGGRALVARFLTKEVPPACDPLGAENALVFCTGVFAGTAFSTGHRVSVGCKSPLTGGAKESNVGGTLGQYFAEQGIRMISVFGIPKTGLYFLHIDKDGGVKLLDASEYKEKGTYAVTESLQKRYGENIAVAVIGQAGERKYKAASIQVSTLDGGHPCRAAGRGGTGAVMGSKGLKAVVVEKAAVKYKPKIADENKFNETLKTLTAEFVKWSQVQPVHLYGTVCYVEGMGPSALMPVQNFSGKIFKDWKKVGVEAFMKNIQTRGGKHQRPCQAGCIIQCSNVYNGPDGKYLTGGFEYETIALFGPNCMISDLDKIAQMDYICDDVGVDTMDVGDAVAVAMDCGKLKWGDADGVIALLEEIRKGTEFGAVLGSGCEATGLKLGAKRIPVVKHQGISGYEPRACLSVGVTYATTPQGADHTAGPAMKAGWDDLGRGAATMISRKFQIGLCMYDSFACLMLAGALSPRMAYVAQLYAAMYGGAVDPRRLQVGLGARCITEELAFNKKAGFTLKDDDLPEFFKTDRAPATGSRWAIPRYEIEEMFHF
jgi:aldehyde:ferredoxin oxidoreductase